MGGDGGGGGVWGVVVVRVVVRVVGGGEGGGGSSTGCCSFARGIRRKQPKFFLVFGSLIVWGEGFGLVRLGKWVGILGVIGGWRIKMGLHMGKFILSTVHVRWEM